MAKQIGDLFRGFTGRPAFLKRRQEEYRKELQRIIERWLKEVKEAGPEQLATLLILLQERLQNAAERNIRRAYKLGLNGKQLNEDDERKIDAALDSNRVFLQTSLLPAIEQRIRTAQEGGEDFSDAVENSEAFSTNRGGLYAGLFWTMIWVGFASAMVRTFGQRAMSERPVRRLLDPRSSHCKTCPPKAREYASWDEMLILCGGLPADGSDACYSNCNCGIQIFNKGSWVYVI